MEYTTKRESDMRVLRASVLNGIDVPLAVAMRLEAQGLDVSETIVRIRSTLPMHKAVA